MKDASSDNRVYEKEKLNTQIRLKSNKSMFHNVVSILDTSRLFCTIFQDRIFGSKHREQKQNHLSDVLVLMYETNSG